MGRSGSATLPTGSPSPTRDTPECASTATTTCSGTTSPPAPPLRSWSTSRSPTGWRSPRVRTSCTSQTPQRSAVLAVSATTTSAPTTWSMADAARTAGSSRSSTAGFPTESVSTYKETSGRRLRTACTSSPPTVRSSARSRSPSSWATSVSADPTVPTCTSQPAPASTEFPPRSAMPHNTSEQLRDVEQALILARGGAAGIPVRHGQWSAEVRGDEVADICFAGVPLLRAIRPVIRDRDWNTVPVRVEAMEHSPDGLTAMLAFRDDEVGFDGRLRLLVDPDRLTVILEATSTQ